MVRPGKVLWWVDIAVPSLNRFDHETGENSAIPMDENVGSIGLRNGGGFIAGLRFGLWLLGEPETGEIGALRLPPLSRRAGDGLMGAACRSQNFIVDARITLG